MVVRNDPEFGKNVIKNIMDVFITPEVTHRQESGKLPRPMKLQFAQVILFPDERKPLIRINEEVKAIIKIRYKPGISKKFGDRVLENEIEGIEKVELGPDDDPNCGHIFLYLLGKSVFLSFDFRTNRDLAHKYIQLAKEFLKAASLSLENALLSPFIDTLFNAAELAIKAMLLVTYDYSPSLGVKSTHSVIQTRYSRFADAGNVLPQHQTIFNKLSGYRIPARYLKGKLPVLSDADKQNMLAAVRKMIEDTEQAAG